MSALPNVCQGLYLDVALRFADVNNRDAVMKLLGQGGIRALLKNDRDLAEALAIVSAATQLTPIRPAAEVALSEEGLDPSIIDQLLAINAEGFELLLARDLWLLTLV